MSDANKKAGSEIGALLDQNLAILNNIKVNIASSRLAENGELLGRFRDNLTAIVARMDGMKGVMGRMPPLPVNVNTEAAGSAVHGINTLAAAAAAAASAAAAGGGGAGGGGIASTTTAAAAAAVNANNGGGGGGGLFPSFAAAVMATPMGLPVGPSPGAPYPFPNGFFPSFIPGMMPGAVPMNIPGVTAGMSPSVPVEAMNIAPPPSPARPGMAPGITPGPIIPPGNPFVPPPLGAVMHGSPQVGGMGLPPPAPPQLPHQQQQQQLERAASAPVGMSYSIGQQAGVCGGHGMALADFAGQHRAGKKIEAGHGPAGTLHSSLQTVDGGGGGAGGAGRRAGEGQQILQGLQAGGG